jgi:hypothetical protein
MSTIRELKVGLQDNMYMTAAFARGVAQPEVGHLTFRAWPCLPQLLRRLEAPPI